MKNFAAPLLGLAVMARSTFVASAQTASEIELTRAEIQTAREAIIAEGMKLTLPPVPATCGAWEG